MGKTTATPFRFWRGMSCIFHNRYYFLYRLLASYYIHEFFLEMLFCHDDHRYCTCATLVYCYFCKWCNLEGFFLLGNDWKWSIWKYLAEVKHLPFLLFSFKSSIPNIPLNCNLLYCTKRSFLGLRWQLMHCFCCGALDAILKWNIFKLQSFNWCMLLIALLIAIIDEGLFMLLHERFIL